MARSRVYVSRVECPSPGAASGGEEKKRKRKREAGLKVWPGRIYHIYDYIRVRSTLNPPSLSSRRLRAGAPHSLGWLCIYIPMPMPMTTKCAQFRICLPVCVCVFNERMGNSLHFIRHESRRCCRRTGSPTGKYI